VGPSAKQGTTAAGSAGQTKVFTDFGVQRTDNYLQ
jgi:hypothetical protein